MFRHAGVGARSGLRTRALPIARRFLDVLERARDSHASADEHAAPGRPGRMIRRTDDLGFGDRVVRGGGGVHREAGALKPTRAGRRPLHYADLRERPADRRREASGCRRRRVRRTGRQRWPAARRNAVISESPDVACGARAATRAEGSCRTDRSRDEQSRRAPRRRHAARAATDCAGMSCAASGPSRSM